MRARALVFDFNGTLSHDEPVLAAIFGELFAEHGKPLSAQEYFDELAGRSDTEIVRTWLGDDHPDVDAVIAARVERYRERVGDGSTVPEAVREAVRYAAARVPVAVVSGAARAEIETVLAGSGLSEVVQAIVSGDDVARGKPDPEGYVRALALLDAGLAVDEVVVFEDTQAGVAAAKAAGMRCLAVLGTLAPARLAAADGIVERIDVPLVRKLVG